MSRLYKGMFPALCCLAIILSIYAATYADDIIEQKKELEQIKQEMDNSQKSLDSLKGVEKSVLKEISNYDQQAAANQAVLKKLNNKLSAIRKESDRSKGIFEQSKNRFESAQSRYLNNLRYYYTGSFTAQTLETDEINSERDGFRKLTYLRALAAYDKEDLSQTSDYLIQAENEYDQIVSEEKQVGNAQKQKRSEYVILTSHKEKKERDLSKLRRKKEREADRLLTLSETARQMEDLIARLEKARKARDGGDIRIEFDFSTGNFISYKGGLPAPLKGKITNGYGWKTDKITNLKSFSNLFSTDVHPPVRPRRSDSSPIPKLTDPPLYGDD